MKAAPMSKELLGMIFDSDILFQLSLEMCVQVLKKGSEEKTEKDLYVIDKNIGDTNGFLQRIRIENSWDAYIRFLKHFQYKALPKYSTVFKHGDDSTFIYLLLRGEVTVLLPDFYFKEKENPVHEQSKKNLQRLRMKYADLDSIFYSHNDPNYVPKRVYSSADDSLQSESLQSQQLGDSKQSELDLEFPTSNQAQSTKSKQQPWGSDKRIILLMHPCMREEIRLQANGYFGELACEFAATRTATVVCTTDCEFAIVPAYAYLDLTHMLNQNKTLIARLRRINEMFATMDVEQILVMLKLSSIRGLTPKTTIFNIGDKADYIYFIESGQVVISQIFPNSDGKPEVVAEYGKGSYFGEDGLFMNRAIGKRVTTARVTKPTTIVKLPGEFFFNNFKAFVEGARLNEAMIRLRWMWFQARKKGTDISKEGIDLLVSPSSAATGYGVDQNATDLLRTGLLKPDLFMLLQIQKDIHFQNQQKKEFQEKQLNQESSYDKIKELDLLYYHPHQSLNNQVTSIKSPITTLSASPQRLNRGLVIKTQGYEGNSSQQKIESMLQQQTNMEINHQIHGRISQERRSSQVSLLSASKKMSQSMTMIKRKISVRPHFHFQSKNNETVESLETITNRKSNSKDRSTKIQLSSSQDCFIKIDYNPLRKSFECSTPKSKKLNQSETAVKIQQKQQNQDENLHEESIACAYFNQSSNLNTPQYQQIISSSFISKQISNQQHLNQEKQNALTQVGTNANDSNTLEMKRDVSTKRISTNSSNFRYQNQRHFLLKPFTKERENNEQSELGNSSIRVQHQKQEQGQEQQSPLEILPKKAVAAGMAATSTRESMFFLGNHRKTKSNGIGSFTTIMSDSQYQQLKKRQDLSRDEYMVRGQVQDSNDSQQLIHPNLTVPTFQQKTNQILQQNAESPNSRKVQIIAANSAKELFNSRENTIKKIGIHSTSEQTIGGGGIDLSRRIKYGIDSKQLVRERLNFLVEDIASANFNSSINKSINVWNSSNNVSNKALSIATAAGGSQRNLNLRIKSSRVTPHMNNTINPSMGIQNVQYLQQSQIQSQTSFHHAGQLSPEHVTTSGFVPHIGSTSMILLPVNLTTSTSTTVSAVSSSSSNVGAAIAMQIKQQRRKESESNSIEIDGGNISNESHIALKKNTESMIRSTEAQFNAMVSPYFTIESKIQNSSNKKQVKVFKFPKSHPILVQTQLPITSNVQNSQYRS